MARIRVDINCPLADVDGITTVLCQWDERKDVDVGILVDRAGGKGTIDDIVKALAPILPEFAAGMQEDAHRIRALVQIWNDQEGASYTDLMELIARADRLAIAVIGAPRMVPPKGEDG